MPRMAWHDVHTMVEGPVVSDIVRHFVERWNDARFNRRDKGIVNAGVSFSAHSSVDIESDKKRKEKRKKNTIFLKKKNTIVENKNFTKHSKTLRKDKAEASNKAEENNKKLRDLFEASNGVLMAFNDAVIDPTFTDEDFDDIEDG